MKLSKPIIFAAAMLTVGIFTGRFSSASIQNFDTQVNIGSSQAPDVWYPDRFAPKGFSSPEIAPDGRTGTLKHSIDISDSNGSRPNGFNTPFYNTQGRKYDLEPGSDGAFIELYVDVAWDSVNQIVSEGGRLASLWATTNTPDAPSDPEYPIIEFSNDTDGSSTNGFRVWNGLGWVNVGGFDGYGQWYQIGFTVDGAEQKFYVDGVLVHSVADTRSTSLNNVILQGYNAGNSYDIYWDNGSFGPDAGPVPEPAALAIWSGIGLVGLFARYRRKRQQVA